MIKKCEQCEKEFEAKGRAKFCSDACKMKAYRSRQRKEKECLSCGQVFIPKHGAEIYCCDYCREFEAKERARLIYRDYHDTMDAWQEDDAYDY